MKPKMWTIPDLQRETGENYQTCYRVIVLDMDPAPEKLAGGFVLNSDEHRRFLTQLAARRGRRKPGPLAKV